MDINWARINEALYYTASDSGASTSKAKGAVIGVVSTMMAFGFNSYNECYPYLIKGLPDNLRVDALPAAWFNLDSHWTLPFHRLVRFKELLNELPEDMREYNDPHGHYNWTCRDVLLDKYLYVMAILQRETDRVFVNWNSDLNGASEYKPDIYYNFAKFRKGGSQYIAEWAVSDRRKPVGNSYNFHGQNTSQWLYAGALMVQDGRVSVHT